VPEDDFVDAVADRLAALPHVRAVSLGGSRADGTQRPDSDWDFAVYYRGPFDPDDLRAVGWGGTVFDVGAWGGGVFNGGAWLTIDGRRTDVHYRDLDVVDHEMAEASYGRFRIEPLLFHLAGIPTYLLLAELALNRVLRGSLPRPDFPAALRRTAPELWWERADLTFGYARDNHAARGERAACLGLVVQAASLAAHAILAAGGQWVRNEKSLLARAGLAQLDEICVTDSSDPSRLQEMVDETRRLCETELAQSRR
jgi:hypothetical protein